MALYKGTRTRRTLVRTIAVLICLSGLGLPLEGQAQKSNFLERFRNPEFRRPLSQDVNITDDPLFRDVQNPKSIWEWFANLQDDNHLVSVDCRLQAIDNAAAAIKEPDATSIFEEKKQLLQSVLSGNIRMTVPQFIDQFVECEDFCGFLLTELFQCYMNGLRQHEKFVVCFEVGHPYDSWEAVDPDVKSEIVNFVWKAMKEGKSLRVEGRHSVLNAREDVKENYDLVTRRIEVVANVIREQGFPGDRLQIKHVDWQPPWLSEEQVARQVGLGPIWDGLSTKTDMDQSVLLVAY